MSDEMKSAVELAMEKLDRELGAQVRSLTARQKEEIAEIRSLYRSKIAQAEISAQTKIREALLRGDAALAAQAEQELGSEKQRLERLMEKEVESVRNAPEPKSD